jgi:hypothetical protein
MSIDLRFGLKKDATPSRDLAYLPGIITLT